VRKVWLAACLACLTGCAGSQVYLASSYVSAGKVAVLPITNESNDLDGPIFVRKLLHGGLAARGFQVLPLDQIDAQLKEQGFTDGGQLRATTPQKIGEWTGADTLLYSTLENFDYLNVGFYAQRRVTLVSKLVDTKTGERLWEAERGASTRAVATNKKQAERLFAAQLAVKAVEKMTHVPLQPESRLAVDRLLVTLPSR
jgi:hypothetical protein